MRKILMFFTMFACTGCPDGERCDMATYEAGCDGKGGWTYCADKSHTGMKKLYPTIQRIPCERDSTCMEFQDFATCVAEPAQTCTTVNETRCMNGLKQTCRDVDAVTQRSGVKYWYWTGGLSCDGTEGMP